MHSKNYFLFRVSLLFLLTMGSLTAQLSSNVYLYDTQKEDRTIHHELKINEDYFIYTVYETTPAKFIKTVGGFYSTENDTLKVALEFNSNYENDRIAKLHIPYTLEGQQLVLDADTKMTFKAEASQPQPLDGQWLFATRGPDTGQERRGGQNTRKTLKFLLGERFQWIAYDTDGFLFKGTGGGHYTAVDGKYTEQIQYFSRDNSRVGASLMFDYELKGDDWHHRGKNSKGKPMYELWSRRLLTE